MKRIGYLIIFLLFSAGSQAQLNVTWNDTIVCEDDTIWLMATGYDSINWTSSAVLSADTGQSVYLTGNTSGSYSVKAVAFNSGSPVPQDSVALNVHFRSNHLFEVGGSVLSGSGAIDCFTDTLFFEQCIVSGSFALTTFGADLYTWEAPTLSLDTNQGDSINVLYVAGDHFITIFATDTALGLSDSMVIHAKINALPTVSVLSSAAIDNGFICLGSSATIQVTTSLSNTIVWSPATALDTTAGPTVISTPDTTRTYSVQVTDSNGCVTTRTNQVKVNSEYPVYTVAASISEICPGASTSILASGSGAISRWSWSPSESLDVDNEAEVVATPTTTTTYALEVSKLGCRDTTEVTITVLPAPTMSVALASGQTIALDETETVTVTCPECISYIWKLPGSSIQTTSNVRQVSPNVPGAIVITITGIDANTCQSKVSTTINVDSSFVGDPFAVEELDDKEISIHQAGENILVQSGSPIMNVGVYDLLGSKVMQLDGKNQLSMELSHVDFASGIYVISVQSKGNSISKKIYLQ